MVVSVEHCLTQAVAPLRYVLEKYLHVESVLVS